MDTTLSCTFRIFFFIVFTMFGFPSSSPPKTVIEWIPPIWKGLSDANFPF